MTITLTQLHEYAATRVQKHLDYIKHLHSSLGEHLGAPSQYLEMLESNAESLFKHNYHALIWGELQGTTSWLLEHPKTEPKQRLQDWLKHKTHEWHGMCLQSTDWQSHPMRRFRENRQCETLGWLLQTLKSKIEELE